MLTVTILGCGPSPGIPIIGNYWGACDPLNPKNRRTRASIMLQKNQRTIVIDSSPDFRQQLLREKVEWVDAILYTHAHADHCHGINDVFCLGRFKNQSIPVYADAETLAELKSAFSYAFVSKPTANVGHGYYRPHLEAHAITSPSFELFQTFTIQHFEQDHGFSKSFGYRIGSFAYCTDLIGLPAASWERLAGVETWVVDCLRLMPHETHAHLDLTLEWVNRLKPKQTFLTHLGSEMDYENLLKRLPDGVFPCYDGLKIHIKEDIKK